MKKIIDEFDDNIYVPGMTLEGDRMPTKQEKDTQRRIVVNKILAGEITTFFVEDYEVVNEHLPLSYQIPAKVLMPPDDKPQNKAKLISKLKEILSRKKREYSNEDERIAHKH